MLYVFICEDDPIQRKKAEAIVHSYTAPDGVGMELALSTASPAELLDYLETHPNRNGLFFLDVDLGADINGIELGAKIRELDHTATIVFITTHAELAYLTFAYKVEAMDYIAKDSPEGIEGRARECMELAYQRYLVGNTSPPKYFRIQAADQVWNIPHDDILFCETDPSTPHKLIMHTENGLIGFRDTISEVEKIGSEFYSCHKSYVVNTKKIKTVDKAKREVEMISGDRIPVAVRKISELLKLAE